MAEHVTCTTECEFVIVIETAKTTLWMLVGARKKRRGRWIR